MFYLYILYSASSDLYYVGSTEQPLQRLKEHNSDPKDTFTSKHRPWAMVALFEVGPTRGEAVKLERFIKKQKSRSLIEKLIDKNFKPKGKLAQLVRAPYSRD